MAATLSDVLAVLRKHEPDLRRRGVRHAAVFGSVARGEQGRVSDVDVLVDLDPSAPIGVFQYARLTLDLGELIGAEVDLADRETLKPSLRDKILSGAIDAF
jgi:predicted nucleotidyltransferase